jgi:GNAT superfamily N-acetyltransferase
VEGLEIEKAGLERLEELRPLWESLHEHHASVAPDLKAIGSVRAASDSWEVRRTRYRQWLAESDAFALIAEVAGRPVGYAVVHMRGPEETWTTGQVAELETLTVLPELRGRGVGTALVEQVFRELRRLGVIHFTVGVIASNTDAVRFYERLGLERFLVSFIGTLP